MADESTILRLAGVGIPPYAARGLIERLKPIEASGYMRRTVNGTLVDLSSPELRRYRVIIEGRDQDPPAFDDFWPGMELTVDCITELSYETDTSSPGREVVPDSEREADGFTFYRPRLSCLAIAWDVETDEWGAEIGWFLELEEKEPT